jgi:biotin transport system substrate-specific component
MHSTLLASLATRDDDRALRIGEQVGAVVFITVLTAVAAQISLTLPFTPVPFTFQPMVVLIGACALGGRLGMTSQVLYLLLGLAGLPVFAASPLLPQGVARLIGPTGGYLMAYPLAALVTGALAERGLDRRYLTALVAMAAGLAVIFAGGLSWLMIVLPPAQGFADALRTGFTPFIVGDAIKLAVAAGVMPSLWWLTGSRDR